MKDIIYKIKIYYFKKVIIPRYTKAAMIFGEMLSYSYMGEPVGFKRHENKIHNYMKISVDFNIKPWTYDQMAGVGWGYDLPILQHFKDEEEKAKWWKVINEEKILVKEEQKRNLAQVISAWLKD